MPVNNKIKFAIILCVVLVIGVGIFSWYSKKHTQSPIVTERDPNLNEQTSNIYENELKDLDNQLAAATSDTDKAHVLQQIGLFQYLLGQFQKSKDSFDESVKLNPNDAATYVDLYQTLVLMQDYNGALDAIQKASKVNPASADIWLKYADLATNKLAYANDQVNGIYADAVNKTKSNIDIITNYATFLEQKMSNLQAAKEYWQKAAQVDPKNKAKYDPQIARLDQAIKQNNKTTQ